MNSIHKNFIKEMEKIDQLMSQNLGSDIDIINKVTQYVLAINGKKIRPLLCIIIGKLLRCNDTQLDMLCNMATAIEYIHTSSLLHDDVLDESDMRRGSKTVRSTFGNQISILVGDFVFTKAMQLVLSAKSIEICEAVTHCTNKISEGELLQLVNNKNLKLTRAKYMQVIYYKTGILFETAAKVTAMVCNVSQSLILQLSQYAKSIGIAFQIVDDVLDYTSKTNTLGKDIANDLNNGRLTLPLIIALEKCTIAEQEIIIEKIHHSDDMTHNDTIINIIKDKYNIMDECKTIITTYAQSAIQCLDSFNNSQYHDILINLSSKLSDRLM